MKPVAAFVITLVSLGALGAAAPQLSVLPSLCLAGSLVGILPPDLDVIECQNGEFCSPLLPSAAEAILQALGMSDAPIDIGTCELGSSSNSVTDSPIGPNVIHPVKEGTNGEVLF